MMHLLNMLVAKLIMLQVQWDESSSVFRPERVSPWELEPIVANSMRSSHPPPQRNKRPRPPGLPSPTTAPSTPGILFFFSPLYCSYLWQLHLVLLMLSSVTADGLWKSPAVNPSSVPLFSPSANGGNKSFGVSIGSAFWPTHADSAAESFASAVNNESPT